MFYSKQKRNSRKKRERVNKRKFRLVLVLPQRVTYSCRGKTVRMILQNAYLLSPT